MIVNFNNIGFVETLVKAEVLDNVKAEVASIEANPRTAEPTYWAGSGPIEHEYMLSERSQRELEYVIAPYLRKFQSSLNIPPTAQFLQSLVFGRPWVQIRKPTEHIPMLQYGQIVSWLVFLQVPQGPASPARLPTQPGSVDLYYTNTIGAVKAHRVTPQENKLILFPGHIPLAQHINTHGVTHTVMGSYKIGEKNE